MKPVDCPYEIMILNSHQLIIPRETYQRKLTTERVEEIVSDFDERIANEPKVSCRNGRYYVFDGQHTINARIARNGGRDLPIRCKVYYGMTESDEALLFAKQTGASAKLTPGAEIRANIYGGKENEMHFLHVNESIGLTLDYDQKHGYKRIACIKTAFEMFKAIGPDKYKEAMCLLLDAWHGDPDSLRAENVKGMCHFVDLYHGEYNPKRMVSQLRKVDPLTIYREGRAIGNSLAGYKKYLYQVYRIYNGSSKKNALPMKF
ncbi:MAG: type II toxin-antitoxin system PemK/MazF family toxin [Clostridiales bacterium]|nr:type II toxin-antitoxin system PemK/MazF family toxin [Clostridiales bacterium]